MENYENPGLTQDEINEMDERRIESLSNEGINENEVLGEAHQNLNTWNGYWNENIVRGKDDMNFVLRDQWTAIERSEFSRLFKPAMTFNKIYPDTKKIAGEQRKNKPDLIVRSLTGKATQEQINLRADLVRTISYQSQNDLVYQTAFKSALMMGFGAFQIEIEYESPRSFNQVLKYRAINDPTRTAFDPSATKPHKGDGNFACRQYLFSKEEFAATYPYIHNPISYTDPYYLLDFQWETRDMVVVADYYVKEWYPLLIYKLSDGTSATVEEWDKMQENFKIKRELVRGSESEKVIMSMMPKIVAERQTQDYRLMHYRLTKDRIIDFTEWPSRHLPIIFVDGDSYFIEGRQYTKSFVHEARDAQKFINYVGSEIAAEIKNRRREQWLGTPDNIVGYEQDWRNPELQMGILRAKPDPKTGAMPTKQQAWDLSPQLMQNFQRGTQDIREILGFSEQEALQGRDISGKARRERKLEGSMSAYVFFDNLNQAIEQSGRCVLDLLPTVYGGDERTVVISKKDGRTEYISLNKKMPDGTIQNELSRGEYDIEIDTGPSFAVQKEVALEMFQQTLQAFPQAFPLIADLWAANLDVQFMPQIKERFQSIVPPEILAKEQGKEPPQPKPNPQAEMMQAELKMKAQELKIKEEKLQLEKQQLILDAEKAKAANQLNIYDHQANILKSAITHDLDKDKHQTSHSIELTKILSDLHKHHNPNLHPKEK